MSHKVTPDPKDAPPQAPRPKTDIERKQEKEQALRTSDMPKRKKKKGGPMPVGVNFDHSTEKEET